MTARIVDHVWRPPVGAQLAQQTPIRERLCDYMNCGRPRDEHAHASRRHERCACREFDRDISTDDDRCYCGHVYDDHLDDGLGPCTEAAA
jgi:hypothetical protein